MNGTPRRPTASSSASRRPSRASNAARHAGNAPSPGSTLRSARATASGSAVTSTDATPA